MEKCSLDLIFYLGQLDRLVFLVEGGAVFSNR